MEEGPLIAVRLEVRFLPARLRWTRISRARHLGWLLVRPMAAV
jgi:hypothetical protein